MSALFLEDNVKATERTEARFFRDAKRLCGSGNMDDVDEAIEVYLNKGDALLFVDGLIHGGSSRTTTEGERRVIIYRYGPVWGATRFGYQYSKELLDRLTPERRKILEPVPPVIAGSKIIPREN